MRNLRRSPLVAVLLALSLVAVPLAGCASGTQNTEQLQNVPSSTVQAQNAVGDAIKAVDDLYKDAVAKHNAKFRAGQPDEVERQTLADWKAAMVTALDTLAQWKAGVALDAPTVLRSVTNVLPVVLDVLVQHGTITADTAKVIKSIVITAGGIL